MPTDVVVQDVRPPILKLTAQEIRADINLIQTILQGVMQSDVHYGIIPGCQKPSLYKPGAEKIMATFRLNAEPMIEDLSTADTVRYRIKVRLTHQVTQYEIGWGLGECSSEETKYKWIKADGLTWNATPEDRRRTVWKNGKDKPYEVQQVRANIADVANTVLKMAKKRALVDAVLTATAASDIFDQDIEDLPENLRQNVTSKGDLPPMPQRASEKQPAPPAERDDVAQVPPTEKPPQRRMIDASSGKPMKAKFDAPCKLCSKQIAKGTDMVYIYEGPDKGAYHPTCVQG